MKTKILINWENRTVMSEKTFEDEKAELKAIMSDKDSYHFSEWLDDNYSITEIWFMSEDEKVKNWERYLDFVEWCVKDEYNLSKFEKIEIEI